MSSVRIFAEDPGEEPKGDPAPKRADPKPAPVAETAVGKIMVAYSSQFTLGTVIQILEHRLPGVAIDVTTDGKTLVEYARTKSYALILAAGRLDELDGFTAIQQIRAFDDKTPIYTVGHNGMQQMAHDVGANGHIVKSNIQWHLGEVIDHLFYQKPGTA